jgi:hypothetical protein
MDMSSGLTVVDGCVSWVPGTIVAYLLLISLKCHLLGAVVAGGGGVVWSGGGSRSIIWPRGGEV